MYDVFVSLRGCTDDPREEVCCHLVVVVDNSSILDVELRRWLYGLWLRCLIVSYYSRFGAGGVFLKGPFHFVSSALGLHDVRVNRERS